MDVSAFIASPAARFGLGASLFWWSLLPLLPASPAALVAQTPRRMVLPDVRGAEGIAMAQRRSIEHAGMPANTEAERYVLGSILLDDSGNGAVFEAVAADLAPADFSIEKHRRIFQGMTDLHQRGEPIDDLTLSTELDKRAQLQSVDGVAYLASLSGGLPRLSNIGSHAAIVRKAAERRRLIELSNAVIARAVDASGEPEQISDWLSQQLNGVARPSQNGHISALDLLSEEIPSGRWAVSDLLPPGAHALVAKPKVGKTILAEQVALDIVKGRPVFGDPRFETESGPVIYIDLENGKRIIRQRIARLALGNEGLDRLQIHTEMPKLAEGGAVKLDRMMGESKPRLPVIDTLMAVVGSGKSRNDVFRSDYAETAMLRDLAHKHQTTVLVVHHSRKAAHADGSVLDVVAGTGGVAGGLDGVMVLRKDAQTRAFVLHVVNREMEELELALQLDMTEGCGWRLLGSAQEVRRSDSRQEILDHLKVFGPSGPGQIATALGRNGSTTRTTLGRMFDNGDITRDKKGRYFLGTPLVLVDEVDR